MIQRACLAAVLAAAFAGVAGPACAAPPVPGDVARIAYGPEFFAAKRPVTAYDMVLLLPGFSLEEGEEVRGYAGSGGNVLVNGRRPSTKVDTLADILQRIAAAGVARIELIRGAPGVDMQGHTVLANVVLTSAGADQAALTVQALLYGDGHTGKSAQFDWSRRSGEVAAEASLVVAHLQNPQSGDGRRILVDATGGLISDARAQVAEPQDKDEASGALQVPALGGLLRLKGSALYFSDRLEEENHVVAGLLGPHENHRSSTFRTRQGEASGDFQRNVFPGATLELIGIQTLEKLEDVGDAFLDFELDNTRVKVLQGESIGRASLEYVLSPLLTVRGGGEFDFNFLDGDETLSIGGVPTPVPASHVRVTERRSEGFVAAVWKPIAALSLDASARLEASRLAVTGDVQSAKSFVFPKPRLVASWTFAGEDQLRLRLERTVSQLDFGDFVTSSTFDTQVVTAGNPRLEPERDWIAEAALEAHLEGVVATATVSHAWLDKVIDDTPFEGLSSRGNIGRGRRETAAVELAAPLAAVGMAGGQLKASGTWKWSQVTDPTTGARRQITLDQPFSGSAILTNEAPRLKSSWRLDAVFGYRQPTFLIDEIQHRRFETQVNFQWEYKPSPAYAFDLQAQNLTGARRLRTREIFDGLRSTGRLDQIETYVIRNRPRLMISVRRGF